MRAILLRSSSQCSYSIHGILLVTRIDNRYAHYDLLTIQGMIERHRKYALHQCHGFLIYPIQSRTLHHFGLYQLSRIGHDGFDQNFELA